jgi:hypothetical protein
MTTLFRINLYVPRAQFTTLALRARGICYPQRHNFQTFVISLTKWLYQNIAILTIKNI